MGQLGFDALVFFLTLYKIFVLRGSKNKYLMSILLRDGQSRFTLSPHLWLELFCHVRESLLCVSPSDYSKWVSSLYLCLSQYYDCRQHREHRSHRGTSSWALFCIMHLDGDVIQTALPHLKGTAVFITNACVIVFFKLFTRSVELTEYTAFQL